MSTQPAAEESRPSIDNAEAAMAFARNSTFDAVEAALERLKHCRRRTLLATTVDELAEVQTEAHAAATHLVDAMRTTQQAMDHRWKKLKEAKS